MARESAAKSVANHQPTKAEMEEVIAVRGKPDQIARAVLRGGTPRREPKDTTGKDRGQPAKG